MIVFDRLWETMRHKGISAYKLREYHHIENRTLRRLRANQSVTTYTLNQFCRILDCELSDIAEYRPDPPDELPSELPDESDDELLDEEETAQADEPFTPAT